MLGKLRKVDEHIVAAGNRLQAYTALFLLFFGTSGLITLFVRWADPFAPGWGWAEAVTVGFAITCGLVLIASLAMIAWRFLRPLPVVSQVQAQVDARFAALDERGANYDRRIQALSSDIKEIREQINRVGNQVQESIAGVNNRLNDRITKLERLADDPPPTPTKVNWIPWKAMPDYSVMQLARLLTLRDPGENDLSGEVVAYRDLIMKCMEGGSLPYIKEFAISDWDGKAYETKCDHSTRIKKDDALFWARHHGFPIGHVE